MEIKEYDTIVSSPTVIPLRAVRDLEGIVRGRLKEGWVPLGGISFVYDTEINRHFAAQTMVK
jgi:hypothetical protein